MTNQNNNVIEIAGFKFAESDVIARKYHEGMGQAVADRTINRKKENGEVEEWADVARRVALGNVLLVNGKVQKLDIETEYTVMNKHLRQATLLMSGRHLQHGDELQPTRNMEVFTNCSTAAFSFLEFYNLLNGSGVGRSYDNDLMIVNWSNMPHIVCCVSNMHGDVQSGRILPSPREDAEHMYEKEKNENRLHVFEVPDTREGWAKAVEIIECMAFQERFSEDVLLIDFSKVRPYGSPIGGMQDRPASGPGPLMDAIRKMALIKHTHMANWRKTMFVDHYLAECVLVGGARRAARMSTKYWKDLDVLDFIKIKEQGHLWSSNNSVVVDAEFWDYVKNHNKILTTNSMCIHAHNVFEAIVHHAYFDNSGEPGIINGDKLQEKGYLNIYNADPNFAESKRYKLEKATLEINKRLISALQQKPVKMIVNPCGEVPLLVIGGYCVIADVVPYFAQDLDDAEEAVRVAVRALIRTNTMDSMYNMEVKRTNRIGVGFTGLHEFAWKFFKYDFRDLINEERSKDFWMAIARFKRAVDEEAASYSKHLGVEVPHTNTVIKPAGTTSKLFGLSEGAHLPSMREYLRWVQFRSDDPRIEEYRAKGYPVRELQVYKGTTIVGYPTQPEICCLDIGDRLVTATEATPEEQYQWLRLVEKYWIVGVDTEGHPLTSETGGQVSYTLKYDKQLVDAEHFAETLKNGQSTIRCCSVLPISDTSAFEYLPEEQTTKQEFEQIVEAIQRSGKPLNEDVDFTHVDCSSGACPVDFNK